MKNLFILFLFLSGSLSGFADNQTAAKQSVAGHEFVNLGLPSGTLWATCNIGASSCSEAGNYYSWGEIQQKEFCSWENYAYWIGFYDDDKGRWQEVTSIGDDISCTQYDVVAREWGKGWRMPTQEECRELYEYCAGILTEENGVSGVKIVGRNENSIFLPAAGFRTDKIYYEGDMGFYWSSAEAPEVHNVGNDFISTDAMCLQLDQNPVRPFFQNQFYKYYGMNIRPVISRKDMLAGVSMPTADYDQISIHVSDHNLRIMGNDLSGRVCVCNSAGKILFNGLLVAGSCELSTLPDGIYVVSLLKNGETIYTRKVNVK